MQNHEGKWCWCPDGNEGYEGSFDHEWQAHAAAHDYASQGDILKYEVAQLTHPINLVSDQQLHRYVESLLESIDEACFDEVGGDDAILDMLPTDEQILVEYVRTFMLERTKAKRLGVTNIKQHSIVCGEGRPEGGAA